MSLLDLPMGRTLRDTIEKLRFVGVLSREDAQDKEMRFVVGAAEGVRLYWLVDLTDGVIADAKFQAWGSIYFIAAAEIVCELCMRKNYRQASRLSADLIDREVRDKRDVPAFPESANGCINRVLSAIDAAVAQCVDLPVATDYDTTPIEWESGVNPEGIPGWEAFSQDKKLFLIEEVIDKEVRPYIELDAGGVRVVELKENGDLLISYEGSCTSCHSSTGSTLSAIQNIVRSRLHPSLNVTPVL